MSGAVWVTHSEPRASRLAECLLAAGYPVVKAPLLEIEPLPVPARQVSAGAGGVPTDLVFLSEHAVTHAGSLGIPETAQVHAVGEATAQALAGQGISARVPAEHGSEGLVSQFPDDCSDRRVLIVSGEGGRKALKDELQRRGAVVEEWLCYRRRPIQRLALAPGSVGVILVGSQDGFRTLARLWFAAGGTPEVPIVAASARVASIGKDLGFTHVRATHGVTPTDWLAALAELSEKD